MLSKLLSGGSVEVEVEGLLRVETACTQAV
jgi:hypothetical protein